jgi:hypothetical protein
MRFIAFLSIALAAGCASGPMNPEPGASEPVAVVIDRVPPASAAVVAEEPPTLAEPRPIDPPKPPEASLPQVAPPSKAAAPAVKVPAKAAPASAPMAEPRKTEPPPAVPAKAATPPLDVAALKSRLKDTDGIGVLAKLALKNQMDDLLKQLRAAHAGKASATPLRPLYDTLIAKAVSVLHDGDPGLAGTIAQSREAIWDLLADPVKFHEAS